MKLRMNFSVAPTLQRTLDATYNKMETSAQNAMKLVMDDLEIFSKENHLAISGWDNESFNLERMITGYVVGIQNPYPYEGSVVVPQAPFLRGSHLVRNQAYLDEHYQVDLDVSPPVEEVPKQVIGILHHYMQYSNRLPAATQREEIAVAAIENQADHIVAQLTALMKR